MFISLGASCIVQISGSQTFLSGGILKSLNKIHCTSIIIIIIVIRAKLSLARSAVKSARGNDTIPLQENFGSPSNSHTFTRFQNNYYVNIVADLQRNFVERTISITIYNNKNHFSNIDHFIFIFNCTMKLLKTILIKL